MNFFTTIINLLRKPKRSVAATQTEEVDQYELMKERFRTFTVPWTTHQATTLSQAGFFYSGFDDKVICPFCRGLLGSWEPTDIPILEHARHYPFCEYLRKCQWKLYPINRVLAAGQDVCGPNFPNVNKSD